MAIVIMCKCRYNIFNVNCIILHITIVDGHIIMIINPFLNLIVFLVIIVFILVCIEMMSEIYCIMNLVIVDFFNEYILLIVSIFIFYFISVIYIQLLLFCTSQQSAYH